MQPLFSIITVTFNAATTLPPTLRSVGEQTFRDFEYIIMDGASRDNTVALATASGIPGMLVVSEPDKGIYDAMNKALMRAHGKYVLFLNAGDTFHRPTTLEQYADAIGRNDSPGIVYGQTDIVDAQRRRIAPRHLTAPAELTLGSFADGMVVCHQAFCVLRRLTGVYDMRYRLSADYDWCIRCLQHSRKNVYIDDVVIDYLDEGATTRNRLSSLRERFRIMCWYYGWWRTTLRHVRFLGRFMLSQRRERRGRTAVESRSAEN